MNSLILVAVSSVFLAADTPQGASPLDGTWQVQRREYDGDDNNFSDTNFVIAAGVITARQKQGDKEVAGAELRFTLNPGKEPKTIDVTTQRQGKAVRLVGIYRIDGDTARICLAKEGEPRPSEFVSEKGSKHELIVLRRLKP